MSESLIGILIRKIAQLETRMERFEAIERLTAGTGTDLEARVTVLETYQMPTSNANVSNPPTDAELDATFGLPAVVGDGFIAFVDDNAGNTDVWLVSSNGTSWWYEQLTKAV